MSFADAEARVNASVVGRLANATATVSLPPGAAGQTIDGIFDDEYLLIDQASGIESSTPAFVALDAGMPDDFADALHSGSDAAIEVRGCVYQVVESKPDGVGITVLRLRKQP